MKITIKSLKQLTYDVDLTDTATIEQLKKLVEEKHGLDSTNMKILYGGIILDDKISKIIRKKIFSKNENIISYFIIK